MGKLAYSTAEIDVALRTSLYRNHAIVTNPSDSPNVLTIAANEINTYKEIPLTLSSISLYQFTLGTNSLIFTGANGTLFAFNGTASVGTNVNNTSVKFRAAVNGVLAPSSTSSLKLDTTTSIGTINASAGVLLNNGDVITIHAMSDKVCSLSIYNTQLQFVEV